MNSTSSARPAPLRIIDTLTLGFNLAVGAIPALAVAVLLDLLYWLGPIISVAQVWQAYTIQLKSLPSLDPSTADTLDQLVRGVGQVNLLQVLSGAAGAFNWPPTIPSFVANVPELATLGPTVELTSVWTTLGALVVLLPLGWLIGSVYLTLVASRLDGERMALDTLIQWILGTWARLASLNLLVLLAALLLSIPVTLALVAAQFIFPPLVGIIGALLLIVGVWVWVHGLLTLPAIVLDRVNPLKAYWRSARVMRRYFWSAVALMLLAFVLNLGLGEAWRFLAQAPIGVPFAILANAFVGTSIAAALLSFYAQRRPNRIR